MRLNDLPIFGAFPAAGLALGLVAGMTMMTPAQADEVTDALENARAAWEEGDVGYALDELEMARQQMMAAQADALVAWLPEAPEGWTRTVSTEMAAGMMMMGGGTGAEATYQGPEDDITITLIADNPMVSSLGAMVGSAAMLGQKIERVGREKFMVDDEGGSVQGVVANHVLIQAEGGEVETMLGMIRSMDLKGLGDYGR